MNTTKIEGPTKVDSTRLSIRLDECEIINTNLIDEIRSEKLNTKTGEVISTEFKSMSFPIWHETKEGVTIQFWIEKQFYYTPEGDKHTCNYITFLVNSKHLKERYFEGITLDTLPLIYEYLLSFKIVNFTYESLMNSRYNDTDICVDFKSTPEHFKGIKADIKSRSSNPEIWQSATNQDNNSGIWTPIRKDPRKHATPSKPFVKFYSKHEDFEHKSISFSTAYIEKERYKNLYRIEATIKNSKHKAHLGISGVKTFGAFLQLDLQLLLQQVVNEYFLNKTKLVTKPDDLTPIEKIVVDLMNELTNKGATNSELFAYFNRADVSRQVRSKLREKYFKLTALDEFNRKQLEINSASNEIFTYLNIGPEL